MYRKKIKQLDLPSDLQKISDTLIKLFQGSDCNLIESAFLYAYAKVKDQKRLNGEPAISHPLMVALKTAKMGLGPNSISAALLHDIIEDNPDSEIVSIEILEKFGEDVHTLVLALTKMQSDRVERSETSEVLAAQLYLLSTVNDLRVIMIKLADKLHNLMTIEGLEPDHQEKYMREIERIYLPIAEYIGLGAVHREMADLLFAKRNPMDYRKILDAIREVSREEKNIKRTIVEELTTICALEDIRPIIEGRLKGITSIHAKLERYREKRGKSSIEHIKDIVAFRILCDTEDQCYLISSALHQFFDLGHPTDDYISNPKPNGYKSIHIILTHPEFGDFEVQIKTHAMHEYNEYGPASHIAYKVSGRSEAKPTDEFSWVKDLSFSSHFYKKNEDKPIPSKVLQDFIFVLTPKYDFIKLPKGSTPIDFAYSLHSDLGNQCIGASVNQRPVAIDSPLQTGDIVEIKTNPKKKYASESWLDFVVTDRAKEMIRKSVRRRVYGM
jgi:GTP diphosphokinase / guanosine-3',5'-bis(diphosphate) 3'-diphosphatase